MIEAEQSLISSLLTNPNCLTDVFDIVSLDDFSTDRHRKIVETVMQLSNEGASIDILSVADRINDLSYMTEIITDAHVMNVTTACQLLQRESMRRKAISNLQNAIGLVVNGKAVDDILGAVAGVHEGLEVKSCDHLTYTELYRNAVVRLDERMRNVAPQGLMTGFSAIDGRLMGLQPSDFMIIGARPAMGKTTYAMNIAENVADAGGNVLVFSLEMSREQLMDRSMASRTMVPFNEIKSGNLTQESLANLQAGSTRVINKYNLTIIDKAAINVDHAANIAKKFDRTRKLDLIVFDYLQLMTAKAGSRFEEISVISRSLKALAKNLGVPVIALSQLSREVDKRPNKRPVNSDLRESGQIEQDADVIQFLYRDEVYDEQSAQKGYCEVITTKFRNGEIGTDILESKLQYCRFADTTWEPKPVEQKQGYTPYAKR